MAFKLIGLCAAFVPLVTALHAKAFHYRQMHINATSILGTAAPTGFSIPYPTSSTVIVTFTGTSTSSSSKASLTTTSSHSTATTVTEVPVSVSTTFSLTSSSFSTGTISSSTSFRDSTTSSSTSSLITATPLTGSPISTPNTVTLSNTPAHTSTGLPLPNTLPDSAIAYQNRGCNTNGTGPAYGWFNFLPGDCQVLFPNPGYNFASLWVQWTSPEYDCCTVQIYGDNNCEALVDGSDKIYTPFGSCVDAGDLVGKSFKLECYVGDGPDE